MLDKIIANKARVKSIISGKSYEAPVAPVVIPEIPVQPEPEVVHVQPEVQPEPEAVHVESDPVPGNYIVPGQELQYPLNHE